jgi:hypothetical protein
MIRRALFSCAIALLPGRVVTAQDASSCVSYEVARSSSESNRLVNRCSEPIIVRFINGSGNDGALSFDGVGGQNSWPATVRRIVGACYRVYPASDGSCPSSRPASRPPEEARSTGGSKVGGAGSGATSAQSAAAASRQQVAEAVVRTLFEPSRVIPPSEFGLGPAPRRPIVPAGHTATAAQMRAAWNAFEAFSDQVGRERSRAFDVLNTSRRSYTEMRGVRDYREALSADLDALLAETSRAQRAFDAAESQRRTSAARAEAARTAETAPTATATSVAAVTSPRVLSAVDSALARCTSAPARSTQPPAPAGTRSSGANRPASGSRAASEPYFDFQVEKPAASAPGGGPRYPDLLRSAGVEGQVLAQFVVDTPTGRHAH